MPANVGKSDQDAPWIWHPTAVSAANLYIRFRQEFLVQEIQHFRLLLSADARYWVWVNGHQVGFGPVRAWPEYWYHDIYDLTPWLKPGRNVVAVLVNHWSEGNFQYLCARPGLTARIEDEEGCIVCETDKNWRTERAFAERSHTPRVSVQQGYEEHYDALQEDGWKEVDYDDERWASAIQVTSPHPHIEPRPIPYLGGERVLPTRILAVEEVAPAQAVWNLCIKPCFAALDHTANFCFVRGYITTLVHSERAQEIELIRPHYHGAAFWVNGEQIAACSLPAHKDVVGQRVKLRRGWNRLLFPYPGYSDPMAASLPAGGVHLAVFVLAVRADHQLRWACRGEKGDLPWAFVGPFPLTAAQTSAMRGHVDYPRVVQAETIAADATEAVAEAIPGSGEENWQDWSKRVWFQPLSPCEGDVFASWCGDIPVCSRPVVDPSPLLIGQGGWKLAAPAAAGAVRVLIDFGHMLVGNISFTVDAPARTVIDIHHFEFIQPDGRHNLATGMNNALRYACRQGMQVFQSLQRRGFRYAWITVRNFKETLTLHNISVQVSTYPQRREGCFACSDEQLNRIWEIGADTLRWCAEDTYTDCPTYEQTHWVGDARNEALVDWVVNGDSRLWHHCLLQAGRSLKRSPLVASHVPSSWENVLPAWSFLWMRSVREYLSWTGDKAGARALFPWVIKNVAGVLGHITNEGLFRIHAWNLFDWAAMDTPNDGIVTHQNCLAVVALNDAAELAMLLGRKRDAQAWRQAASALTQAINRTLWDSARQAYIDCIHPDGRRSSTFSQQTQTAALIAGVARGRRARRCRAIVTHVPQGFVQAGSPFFEFFLLEVLAEERNGRRLLELIRRDWGFMLAQGATSFWEMWTLSIGRLTRSHCHGWSSAPTFFLSTAVLGVKSRGASPRVIEFSPNPGNLQWMRGRVPTAFGVVAVDGVRRGARWHYRVGVPSGCRLINRAQGVVKVVSLVEPAFSKGM